MDTAAESEPCLEKASSQQLQLKCAQGYMGTTHFVVLQSVHKMAQIAASIWLLEINKL